MAKQTTVTLIDDTNGEPAAETVDFALDGKAYEIDLSEPNATRLRDALAPFVASARRTGRAPTRARAASAGQVDRELNRSIREWAKKEGLKISERGRIPSSVLEQYHAAH